MTGVECRVVASRESLQVSQHLRVFFDGEEVLGNVANLACQGTFSGADLDDRVASKLLIRRTDGVREEGFDLGVNEEVLPQWFAGTVPQ